MIALGDGLLPGRRSSMVPRAVRPIRGPGGWKPGVADGGTANCSATPGGARTRSWTSGFTSARLISKDRVALRYGLVQARIQVPDGRGIWPAFWMLGQDIDAAGWPQCGEIDVMEILGHDPEVVHGTAHGPGYSGSAGLTAAHRARASLAEGFHVYSVAGSRAGSAGTSMTSCTPR